MSPSPHRAVAINVGANTSLPGFRGPIYPDGSFEYVPIPERESTDPDASVPTYGDLAASLRTPIPEELFDREVHLDPEFAGYPCCERYTYGDEHGVKAGPLSRLDPGDRLYFYATLSSVESTGGADSHDGNNWLPPEWGAFLIGHFEVEQSLTGEAYAELSPGERGPFANNAHVKRTEVDAAVFVLGTDESRLYDRAVPLSTPEAGSEANDLVTRLSNDSGRGPWWRRVLRFDPDAAGELAAVVRRRAHESTGGK
ncbi:Nmad3 family putative nucleotide modification protein [Halalkaliarchaeum desulfuricum]|nr:hypothetical protein [Halalkaliarchaeum desulfuricum]